MNDFDQKLLNIVEEREIVLFEIQRALFTKRYNLSKNHFEILSIQSISMIYSIWEGFVQKSFQLYIIKLNSLNINFTNYKEEIIIFHMENSFRQIREYPTKSKKKVALFNQLEEFYSKSHHSLHPVVDTKSNVSFEILNSILTAFSIEPFPECWNKYKYPNPNLQETMATFLRYRNSIAHGGDISSEEKVTIDVFTKYKLLVNDLMYEILNKMSNAIQTKNYEKNSTQ